MKQWNAHLRAWLRHPKMAGAVMLVMLGAFPLIVPQEIVSLGFVALQYALFALGLNIVLGWTGLLDLGAAGFVAVGAYATAIVMTQFGWSPLLALPITVLVGFVAGVVLGIPTLRHRLDYFAILTLGFAELVALAIRNWPSVTRGSYGYSGIPATTLPFIHDPLRASPPTGFYYLAAAVLIPSYLFVVWLRSTVLGRRFHVVKHSEIVGQTYGINTLTVKLVAFGLSAAFLSLGGFFWTVYQRSIVWTEFGILLSCMLVSMIVVGGLGNPKGVILGAALVGSSLEIIRRILTSAGWPQNIRFLIFSTALVAFVHLRSRGIIPDRPSWLGRLDSSQSDTTTEQSDYEGNGSGEQVLLEIEGVAKSFGGVAALDGFSLRLAAGECVALIGPNGSGKTTLLNLISGLIRPDRGTIRLSRQRTDGLPAYRIARYGVGRSFQELSVFDDLSIQDNVYVTARRASREDINQALTQFGLTDGTALCESLSYGSKKALDLARLFVEPQTLHLALLDEPTAGLTQREANEVVRTLFGLRKQTGVAMIVVSHDVMFLEALNVDRVVVLHRGRLFKEGPFSFIRTDADVRKLFWGDEEGVLS
jgi:ABC-type branched-subunit amino acid transport system permease subunit/ABC-type branched-subunit amino acid transport system ATPase component